MIDFTITAIESIEMYDNGMEMVKKNVPDAIKVSHTKFKRFCRNKELTCHTNTISEMSTYFDEYDNVVAYFIWAENPIIAMQSIISILSYISYLRNKSYIFKMNTHKLESLHWFGL